MSDGSLKPRPVGSTPASLPAANASGATSGAKDLDNKKPPDQVVNEPLEPPQHVPPLAFPKLLAPMRNVIAASTMLDDLLDYLKANTKGEVVEIVEVGFEDDSKFSRLIDKKAGEFNDAGSNLLVEALAQLKCSTNFRIKAFLTAIGLVINPDIVVNDFIIPSLDKRKHFENADNNNKYVKMLLEQLPREYLGKIFALVKFDGINDNDKFAKSIASLNDGPVEKVLNALVDVSVGENAKIEGVEAYIHVEDKERIQTLVLLIMEKLKKDNKKVPKEPLERLYRSSDETKINDRAMALINDCDEIDPDLFLLESVLDESKKDDSYERVRRFWAIDDYVTKKGAKEAVAGLKRVVLECETPLVVNYATYKLANSCEEDGKVTLVDAIKQKIRVNEPSLPLAFVVSHIDLENSFGDILFRLLNSEFTPAARGISSGFDRISDIFIARAQKNKDNGTTFSHDSDLPPATPMTVFQKVGIIPMIEKIVGEQANQVVQSGTSRSQAIAKINHYEINLVDLMDYAFLRYKVEMNALMSAAVSQSKRTKPGVHAYLLRLAGASISGLEPRNVDELQSFFPGRKIE